MNLAEKNTILITGGGSGLGRGLAEAFHKAGNAVIIAGRRKDVLRSVANANPGMQYEVLDVQDAVKLKSFATDIATKYPRLNVLINMAGIMKPENLNDGADLSTIDDTIATNLTAPLHLTAALLPHLKQQPEGNSHERDLGPRIYTSGDDTDLLRNKSRNPLMVALASLSAQGQLGRGARACAALRPDRTYGQAAGQRSTGHEA